MLYISRLKNDMKLAMQKNYLGVKLCTDLLPPPKNGVIANNHFLQ